MIRFILSLLKIIDFHFYILYFSTEKGSFNRIFLVDCKMFKYHGGV